MKNKMCSLFRDISFPIVPDGAKGLWWGKRR
jgi:hypothetical protein